MDLCEFKRYYRLIDIKENMIMLMQSCEDKAIRSELEAIQLAEKKGKAHNVKMMQKRLYHLLKIKEAVAVKPVKH